MNRYLQLLLLLLLPVTPLLADQHGFIVRSSPVFAQASSASDRVGQVAAGTSVKVFTRKGGWKEIFVEDQSLIGWVRSYQVREGGNAPQAKVETKADSRGFLAGLASFSRKASRFFKSGGSTTSSGTATIGVRGLSEAEIKSAKPDFEQFEIMQQYASDQKRLDKFKLGGQLSANEVAHIKPVKKTATKEKIEK